MLTDYEFEVTKELINIALANSADAFSKMATERVLIREFDLEILNKDNFFKSIGGDIEEPLYILTTDVKGVLMGKSYLLFSEADITKVIKIFSKENIIITNGEVTEFQKAILLELDNIVSAAMVTQISNLLNLFTYGDVPQFQYLSASQTFQLFHEDILTYDVALRVHATLQSYNTLMAPSFIWLFKSDFLVAIKDLVKQKKHLSLMKEK